MINRHRWTKNTLIFGGAAAWGLLLVSCVMVNRNAMMFAPPHIEGAKFVGSAECAQCHEDKTINFHHATHAKLIAEGTNDQNVGCESCHGPGSIHSQKGGGAGTIINPEKNPATCFACHLDKQAEFSMANSHPVMHGKMGCSDCHNPHEGDAIVGGGTKIAKANDLCLSCHEAQRGPYMFEHEALRDGCTSCHNPHGTMNAKMLKTRSQAVCTQCHQQQSTASGQLLIGARDHVGYIARGTCWTSGCHEAVHGSHVNSSLRF